MAAISHFSRLGYSPLKFEKVLDYLKPLWQNLNRLQRNWCPQHMLCIDIHDQNC